MSSVGLALIAGLLSTFSPCVLPLVPIVVGTALGQHRLGPVALAAGLALSFVVIGLFVATVGFAAGFDHDVFRAVAAILLIVIGVVLLVPRTADAARHRVGSGRRLGAVARRWLHDRRPRRPVRCRPSARRGLEPVRRSDARRRFGAGRAGREPDLGGTHDAGLRHRCRVAAAGDRTDVAADPGTLAQPDAGRRPGRQGADGRRCWSRSASSF